MGSKTSHEHGKSQVPSVRMAWYVIETTWQRAMFSVQTFETRGAAVDWVCAHALTPDLVEALPMRSIERMAVKSIKPMSPLPTPAALEEDGGYAGISFDEGRYIAVISDTLQIQDLDAVRCMSVPARIKYDVCKCPPTPKTPLVAVRFATTYGGQGVGGSAGVFGTWDIAVCELWRCLPPRQLGYDLDIASITVVAPNGVAVPETAVEDGYFVWNEDDDWEVFYGDTIARLKRMEPAAMTRVTRSPAATTRVRATFKNDTVSVVVLPDDSKDRYRYAYRDVDGGLCETDEAYDMFINRPVFCHGDDSMRVEVEAL